MVASRTLRLAAATRPSSEVSSASWNKPHQFGSIGSLTGSLATVTGAGWRAVNQEDGDQMDCGLKFGPTVQPAMQASKDAAHASIACREDWGRCTNNPSRESPHDRGTGR